MPAPQQPRPAKKSLSNEVVWQGHPCWQAMISHYVRGTFLAIVLIGILFLLKIAGVISMAIIVLVGLIALAAVFGWGHLIRSTTVYTMTRRRVILKQGVINVRKEQAHLEKINNIIIDRNLIQRILGIGDLEIETANDSGATEMIWWGLRHPLNVEGLLDDLRNDIDDPTSRYDDGYVPEYKEDPYDPEKPPRIQEEPVGYREPRPGDPGYNPAYDPNRSFDYTDEDNPGGRPMFE
jgi:hypothetical protein